ncbi:MAG: hypothetical protein EB010_14310, partial [Acidimicrobiia bacterium]|nr:hypothetical protein [Acidimicrobiia bacterium]
MRVDTITVEPLTGFHHTVASLQVLVIDAGQIQSHTMSGSDAFDRFAESLYSAHARFGGVRPGDHVITHRERAIAQRAGDHRATSLRGEHAVDEQPRTIAIDRCRGGASQRGQSIDQLRHAVSGGCRHRHDGGAFQERALDAFDHFERGQFPLIVVAQIGFGE